MRKSTRPFSRFLQARSFRVPGTLPSIRKLLLDFVPTSRTLGAHGLKVNHHPRINATRPSIHVRPENSRDVFSLERPECLAIDQEHEGDGICEHHSCWLQSNAPTSGPSEYSLLPSTEWPTTRQLSLSMRAAIVYSGWKYASGSVSSFSKTRG